jgi:hypothetical protein
MRRGLVALALTLMVSACGDDASSKATGDEPNSSNPSSPDSSAPPRVSDQTTCDLLFDSGTNPMLTLLEAAEETPGNLQKAKVLAAVRDARDIAETAGPNLAAQLEVFTTEAEAYAGGGGDVARLRAAGLEVTNVCLPYYE